MIRRQLAKPLVDIDEDWFDNPVQDIAIDVLGGFSASHDGACPVKLPGSQTAFAKPKRDVDSHLIVAREKICADLGRALSLPTAPAVVRRPDASGHWNKHSLLSLATLPSGKIWGLGGGAFLSAVAAELERLRVFWTWVGDCDHNAHPGNLLYEVAADGSGQVSLSAIDHSFTLCHGNSLDPLRVPAAIGYGTATLASSEVMDARMAMIEEIEKLDAGGVEGLVQRLSEILTDDEQDRILRILHERRNGLRVMLGVHPK